MQFKPLGQTAISLPEVGLGTCNFTGGAEVLRRGFELGARFVDTAESYGTESEVGRALAGDRSAIFVATKVSRTHFRRRDVFAAADASLRRLGTDHIDLYQLHEPAGAGQVDEALGALEELVDAGKVRFIGVSNFSVRQLRRAERALRRHRIVSNQVRFSLIDRSILGDVLPYCRTRGITVIAYSPLGRKFPRILARDPGGALGRIAAACGRSKAQVALNWCLSHEGVVAIPKSDSADRVAENCQASGWRLDLQQREELSRSIGFRRRSALENALRRRLPPGIKQVLAAWLARPGGAPAARA